MFTQTLTCQISKSKTKMMSNVRLNILTLPLVSQDSSVSIVTSLQDGEPGNHGSIPGSGKRFASSLERSEWFWVPPSILENECLDLYSAVRRSGRWANYSPPCSTEVKMRGFILLLSHTHQLRTGTILSFTVYVMNLVWIWNGIFEFCIFA
jgi:hypothetical protein